MSLRGAKRRGNLPEGNHFKSHARYFCTRGENEHTSKRVSVIACDNVISKAKLSGTPRDTVYSRGKGVCEHKTTDCRLRQSVGQKRSIRRISRKGYLIIKPTQDTFVLLGKRNKQAKDKRLSQATIVWSKAQFMTRAPISRPHLAWAFQAARTFQKS